MNNSTQHFHSCRGCNYYFVCTDLDSSEMMCPEGTVFDKKFICDHVSNTCVLKKGNLYFHLCVLLIQICLHATWNRYADLIFTFKILMNVPTEVTPVQITQCASTLKQVTCVSVKVVSLETDSTAPVCITVYDLLQIKIPEQFLARFFNKIFMF